MLKPQQIQLIHDMSKDIHYLFDIKTPITDITSVITNLDGTFEYTDKVTSSFDIIRTGYAQCSNAFRIIIPKCIEPRRQTFKLGQAIGELIIDMGYMIDPKRYNKKSLIKPNRVSINYEIINYFACEFTMPRDEYTKLIVENQNPESQNDATIDTRAIAEYFNVETDKAALAGNLYNLLA